MTDADGQLAAAASAFDRGAEVARRIEVIAERLRALGQTGVLISTRRNAAWLTVGMSNHVVQASEIGAVPILVTRDGAVSLAPVNEADRIADEEIAGLPIEIAALPWHEPDAILVEAQRRAGGARRREGLLDDADIESWLLPIRSVLGPLELARMAWLGGRVREAIHAALEGVGPGSTEDDAVAELVVVLARDGIRTPVVLAAADDRIERYRHPLPTSNRIGRRLMLVAVAERWGLHAALTKFHEFEPPPPVIAEKIELIAMILGRMVDATRPGSTLGHVVAIAQDAYAEAGYPDEWRLHHQGGTIGYASRERIAIPDDATEMVPGMAFAWNPSIRGAKAESTLVLDDSGVPSVVAEA